MIFLAFLRFIALSLFGDKFLFDHPAMNTAFVNQPALICDAHFPLEPIKFAFYGTGIHVIALFIPYRSPIRSILWHMKLRFF